MRCRVETRAFIGGLATVAGAAIARVAHPEWAILQLRTSPGALRLAIDNPTFSIATDVPADVIDSGEAALPSRLLTDFIEAVDDSEVELGYDEDTRVLGVVCSGFSPHIRGLAMPPVVQHRLDECSRQFLVPAPLLLQCIADTHYAAGSDENRPSLTGVQLEINRSSIVMTATDGHRLIRRSIRVDISTDGIELVVPAKALQEVLRVFSGEAGSLDVCISKSGRQLSMQSGSTNVAMRLLDGPYPSVNHLLGLRGATTIHVNASELTKKVRATTLFATERDHVIRLLVDSDRIRLIAHTREVGDIESAVAGNVAGPGGRVAVNGKYILDLSARLGESDLQLYMTDEEFPVIVRLADSKEFEYIVMSTRISNW